MTVGSPCTTNIHTVLLILIAILKARFLTISQSVLRAKEVGLLHRYQYNIYEYKAAALEVISDNTGSQTSAGSMQVHLIRQ